MAHDVVTIEGIRTYTEAFGDGGPHILWACQADGTHNVEELARKAYELSGELPFTLTAFGIKDWNAELSPWNASIPEAGGAFEGEAPKTLAWMGRSLIPCCKGRPYVIGYSLAGLFSVWALSQCDQLAGAASCSGSLWFPAWEDYAQTASWPQGCNVYLSLGSKEELASNAVLASVGDKTRSLNSLLKTHPSVNACTMEMNRGGHFSDPLGRLAKAIAWIAKTESLQNA